MSLCVLKKHMLCVCAPCMRCMASPSFVSPSLDGTVKLRGVPVCVIQDCSGLVFCIVSCVRLAVCVNMMYP